MLKKTNANIPIICCTFLIIYGCSLTKKVPEGEYLFVNNKFVYSKEDPDINKKKKLINSSLDEYVKQKPPGYFLGFVPLSQWLYNAAPTKFDKSFTEFYNLDPSQRNSKKLDSILIKNDLNDYVGKNLWLSRFLFKVGEPPELLDTNSAEFSAKNLNRLFQDKGFFDSKVDVTFDKNEKSKKAKTIYNIELNDPSYIESYETNIVDNDINDLLTKDHEQFAGIQLFGKRKIVKSNFMNDSKVIPGTQYDFNNFEAERGRIVDYLKNRGYYDFNDSGEDLYFEADTAKSNKRLDVTLFIDKYIQDTIVKDSTKQFVKYKWGNINIFPNAQTTADSSNDSIAPLEFENYFIHYNGDKKYNPQYYTDAFVIRPGSLFRQRQEIQTKQNIFKRDNLNLHRFDIIKRDSLLDVNVYFTPKKKYDLNVFFESFASQYMNFAISPGVTLTTRNLFGNGENLETTIKGNLGSVDKNFTESDKFLNAYELSLETRLKFPYLLAPNFVKKLVPRRFVSESYLRTGGSIQRNVGLDRISYGLGLDVSISSGEFQHRFSFLNTEFINNLKKDKYYTIFQADRERKDKIVADYFKYDDKYQKSYEDGVITNDEMTKIIQDDVSFRNSLTGQSARDYVNFEDMLYRKASISQNVLINSFIYQFVYNQDNAFRVIENPWYGSVKIELAGNLLGLLDKVIGFRQGENEAGNKTSTVFGLPYSQFVKLDLEGKKRWQISSKEQIATRAAFGIIKPYGNSEFAPFSRSYSAGGAFDIRGWWPLTLGPADKPRIEGVDRESLSFDSMKLLFNAEYRYRLTEMFELAYFIDIGNIWSVSKNREEYLFKLNKFYKQFGIGSGYGLRIHIGTFAILRFDLGYKIYNPSYTEGNRWQLDKFNIFKPRLHFGINYPF